MIDDDNCGDGENLLVDDDDTRVHPNKWARGALVALKLFASYENASSAGGSVGWYKSKIQYNSARFANIKELYLVKMVGKE